MESLTVTVFQKVTGIGKNCTYAKRVITNQSIIYLFM